MPMLAGGLAGLLPFFNTRWNPPGLDVVLALIRRPQIEAAS